MVGMWLFRPEVIFIPPGLQGRMSGFPTIARNSRRLQNMGFDADGKLWVIARGAAAAFVL